MKILFLLPYPGYIRYFDSVFAAVLQRGHQLHLAFNGNWKQTQGLEALPEHPLLTVDFEDFPMRRNGRLRAKQIRGTTDYVRYLDRRFKNAPLLRESTEGALPSGLRFTGGSRFPSLPAGVGVRLQNLASPKERARDDLCVPIASVVLKAMSYASRAFAPIARPTSVSAVRCWSTT